MTYQAMLPVKFDRQYKRNECIPEEAIHPRMLGKLIRCGVIMPVLFEYESGKAQLTEASLSELKKDELMKLAAERDIPVKDAMSKKEISALIISEM